MKALIRYSWVFITLVIIVVVMLMATILPVSAQTTGTISGQVINQITGEPIANMTVNIYSADWSWGSATCTNGSGKYTFSDLAYNTQFYVAAGGQNGCEGGASNYAEEYWQDTIYYYYATSITLDDITPDLADINFTLEVGGTVSGRVIVQGSDPPQGIPNMFVQIGADGPIGFHIGVCTYQDGYYTASGIPLNTEFRVNTGGTENWCEGGATNYSREYWQETDWSNAALLTLTSGGGEDISGIDFTLEIGGTVSGTVTESDGITPIANMSVRANANNWGVAGACTDASGNYTLDGVPLNESFFVEAGGDNWWCSGANYVMEIWQESTDWDSATPLTLTSGGGENINGINFTLEPAGTVSGTVTEIDGITPISNVGVLIGLEHVSGACTDINGNYTITGAPLDQPFHMSAGLSYWCGDFHTDYVEEHWQEASDWNSATLLTLTSGGGEDIIDIDFTLEPAGHISGRVIVEGSDPPQGIPNVSVHAFADGWNTNSTCTDANGNYMISNIPLNRDVRVGASGGGNWCGGATDYIQEFWEENPDYYSAIVISLGNTHPVDTTDINFTLEKGGTISGRVTDQITGESIPNMRIDAYVEGIMSTWSACTDESGYYTTDAMPYDTLIKVSASRDNNYCGGSNDYAEEYYDGVDGTYDVALALAVTIPIDGEIFGINIPLGVSDSDGVDTVIEDGAPNNGDGNGDGTPDSQQDDVASLPNVVDSEYVTVDANGFTLTNVEATTNPDPSGDPLPPMVEAPVGFFSFDVEGLTPAEAIVVTMYVPAGTIVESYYKFGPTPDNPTPHWYEFLYDGTTGAQILGNEIHLYLVDGQRGDHDLTANGYIEDPGMPVMVNAAILMVDIMPGDSQTCYNRDGHGNIPVAILGMATFDVHQIIPETVTLDSMGIRLVGKHERPQFSYEDVNGDGFLDLLVHIEDDGLVDEGDTTGVVNALLDSGFYIRGFDEICVEP